MSMVVSVFEPDRNITTSSAYKRRTQKLSTLGRSFMYRTKSRGPKMLPCGTPKEHSENVRTSKDELPKKQIRKKRMICKCLCNTASVM